MKYSVAKTIIDQLSNYLDKIKTDNLSDHPLLVQAEEANDPEITEIVAIALVMATNALDMAIEKIAEKTNQEIIKNAQPIQRGSGNAGDLARIPVAWEESHPEWKGKNFTWTLKVFPQADRYAGQGAYVASDAQGNRWYLDTTGILPVPYDYAKKASEDVPEVDETFLEEIAAIATEFDKSGDPLLMKQASVLDQILLTIGAPKGAKSAFKLAEDKEIEKLREKYRAEALEKSYKGPKEEHDKDLKVADSIKAIENSVKEYRPLEAALSTRTCPDHPGAQMQRVADCTYQCSLDKKVYNYLGGFTTMKGNKVPGGDVATQTQSLGDRAVEHTSFDTRESKLNG